MALKMGLKEFSRIDFGSTARAHCSPVGLVFNVNIYEHIADWRIHLSLPVAIYSSQSAIGMPGFQTFQTIGKALIS